MRKKVNQHRFEDCPFCGSNRIDLQYGSGSSTTYIRAACQKCKAEGPKAMSTRGAVRKWNRQISKRTFMHN